IVDGKFDLGVLMLVGARGGHYDRFVLRFTPEHRAYDLRKVPDVSCSGLNFVTLETGVCLHIDEGESLEVFSSCKGSDESTRISEPALQGGQLFRDGARALLGRGEVLFHISTRSILA